MSKCKCTANNYQAVLNGLVYISILRSFQTTFPEKQTEKKSERLDEDLTKTLNTEEIFNKQKDTVPSREKDFMANHFCQNAAHRPYVH